MVAGEEVGPDGFRWSVQGLAVFFYVDNGLLASTWLVCIQAALDVLTGLLYQVGLWMNVTKKLGMVCQPC